MRSIRRTALAMLAVALPRVALACPVCFGQSDSPLAQGTNSGIYFLLAVTGGVLVAFASFFIYLVRRARMFRDPHRRVCAVAGRASPHSRRRRARLLPALRSPGPATTVRAPSR